MGSVKEVEIIKPAESDKEGEGEFIFSDRYSVFDWGEMPDHIDKKGAALCTLSAYFFYLLEKNGIKTHFLGLIEDGKPKKFPELKSYSNKMRVKVLRVLKPEYEKAANKYTYEIYKKEKKNFLIPLEVIYRNRLPEGSSVFKRLQNGSTTYQALGLDHMPVPGETLKKPMTDVSTKLEHTDRYMDWKEAQAISGLSDKDLKKVQDMILKINKIVSGACKKAGIDNVDGKFEFGMNPEGEIIVIDVLGTPDECRFMQGDFHISKEFARRWYRKTEWFTEIEKAKKEKGSDWKTTVKSKPPALPAEMKNLISQMYLAVTNEITGKKFFDVPALAEIIGNLKNMTLNLPYNILRYKQRVYGKIIPYLYGETLFDSGCGNGEDDVLLLPHFKKITATDITESPLWKERAAPNLTFSVCDGEKLEFPDNSFDTVIEQNMLHHAQNPEKALAEMVRVSKKRIIVLECNRYNPLMYLNMTLIQKHQHFTQARLKKLLESTGAGFEIKHFSARSFPFTNKTLTDFFEKIEDALEKFPPYRPIIEYNLGILTK